MRIVILEDSVDRQAAMSQVIADKFPGFTTVFFNAVAPMINCLETTGLYDVALISLDHDLEMIESAGGAVTDPGTGVEIANWLAKQPTVAPVIVHTTNTPAGDRMVAILREAHWRVSRIVPYSGEQWINENWRTLVRNLIVRETPGVSLSAFGVQIVSSGMRQKLSCEWFLRQIFQAGLSMLPKDLQVGVGLELGYLDRLGQGHEVIGTGISVLRQLTGGAVTEFLEGARSGMPGVRSEITQRFLDLLGVKTMELLLVNVTTEMQVILVLSSRRADFPVRSHLIQSWLREVIGLCELAFLAEMARNSNDYKVRGKSGLTTPPSLG